MNIKELTEEVKVLKEKVAKLEGGAAKKKEKKAQKKKED